MRHGLHLVAVFSSLCVVKACTRAPHGSSAYTQRMYSLGNCAKPPSRGYGYYGDVACRLSLVRILRRPTRKA
jgi:hypothetical protein